MTGKTKNTIAKIREVLDAFENGEDILYWEDHSDGGYWRRLSSYVDPGKCNWLFEDFLENYKLPPTHSIDFVKESFEKQFDTSQFKIVHSFNKHTYFDIADSHGHCRFYHLDDNGTFNVSDQLFLQMIEEQKLVADEWENE